MEEDVNEDQHTFPFVHSCGVASPKLSSHTGVAAPGKSALFPKLPAYSAVPCSVPVHRLLSGIADPSVCPTFAVVEDPVVATVSGGDAPDCSTPLVDDLPAPEASDWGPSAPSAAALAQHCVTVRPGCSWIATLPRV